VARLPRIALTSGEPAGIGPDLCLQLAADPLPCDLICLGDLGLLGARARLLGSGVRLEEVAPQDLGPGAPGRPHRAGTLRVLHSPLAVPAEPGRPDPRNARAVLDLLDLAAAGCQDGRFDAMVTAPVQKSLIIEAGFPFCGHTEYLAERTGAALPVMMLTAGTMRVALATTHLPLKQVSAAITAELLEQVITILEHDLRRWWGIAAPRIAVCGLNPHAGENGHLGEEEQRVIIPLLTRLRSGGIDACGPLPADTVFVPQLLASYDAVLAMYHDQGLPVIKHAHFDQAVNVTLGLPIVRTSVDHGTALELAGTGRARAASLAAAVSLAADMASPAA